MLNKRAVALVMWIFCAHTRYIGQIALVILLVLVVLAKWIVPGITIYKGRS